MKASSSPPNTQPVSEIELSERIFCTMFRTTGMIRQIMAPLFESYGISVAQWVVLRILLAREQKSADPIRLVDLSNHLVVRQPSLTALVNKLATQGLVERDFLPGDRRGRQIRLSPQGREMVEQISATHREKAHRLLSPWDVNEKQQILGLFERFWQHLEQLNQSAEGSSPQRNHSSKETF